MIGGLLTEAFIASLIHGAIVAAIPLLLAALGEQASERAGVLNIGLEGMMVAGAFAGFVTAYQTGSQWLGFGAGAAAGLTAGAVVALLCVRAGFDQVVVGVAMTLGLEGATAMLYRSWFSRAFPRMPAIDELRIPFLADLPVIGPALFQHHPLVYAAVLVVILAAFVHFRTNLGLALKAAGNQPAALDVAGGSVAGVRSAAVLAAGALAGIGGAFIAQVGAGTFVPYVTNGAGFLAIAIAMLAGGRPFRVLAASVGFGLCLALTTAFQVAGVDVPTDAVQALPYLAILFVLALLGRGSRLPAALGVPYRR